MTTDKMLTSTRETEDRGKAEDRRNRGPGEPRNRRGPTLVQVIQSKASKILTLALLTCPDRSSIVDGGLQRLASKRKEPDRWQAEKGHTKLSA